MRFFRDLLLTLAAATIALGALEGGLRLAGVRFNARFYQPEPGRGFHLRPGSQGWNVSEGEVYIRINSDGMRDIERPVARPADTLRIAVIGSCEADARQVELEQTFLHVVKRDLERPHSGPVDVLNFGVPGYTFSQEYVTLRDHALKYDPQVVVLLLQPFNYVRNTRDLYPGDATHQTPFYVLENGQLVPDAITRVAQPPDARHLARYNLIADAMNLSHVAGLVNQARLELAKQTAEWRSKLRPVKAAEAGPVRNDFEYLRYAPDRPAAQTSWAIGDAFVVAMKAECDRRGIEFRIVSVNPNEAVHPDQAVRDAYKRGLQLPTLDAAEQRIGRFCASRGIPLLLLGPPLGEYSKSHHAFLHGDPAAGDNQGFWNVLGHAVVGDVMSRDLLEHSAAVRAWRAK
jgi:hypothetical protein